MPDTERNLLRLLTDEEGFQTAIFLTYGVDLAFFEEALLPTLRSRNCRNHVIFVDAARYEDTLQNLRGSFSWVGSRYVLAPVHLPQGLFHPKIALLVGPDRGRLLVGSGNLTFTGYGSNRELFTNLDWSQDLDVYQPLFVDVWHFIKALSDRFCNQQAANLILAKAERRARWLVNSESGQFPLRFLHNLDEPLLSQIAANLRERQVFKATLIAPFFNPTQIGAVADTLQAKETLYIVQPGRVVGDQEGLTRLLSKENSISLARFLDEDRYIHAKAYVFETDAGATALTGSPNCSVAALGSTAETGNIEAAILANHPDPGHFAVLYAKAIEPIATDEVSAISFGESPSLVQRRRRIVSLLDAAVSGNLLTIRFVVGSEIDRPLTLAALFVGDRISLLPLGEFGEGEHTTTVEVGDVFQRVGAGPVSVCLQNDQDSDHLSDFISNELWLARLDALRSEATRTLVGARPAAEALLGLSDDEERWQALYETLSKLLSDELARISQSGLSPRKRIVSRDKESESVDDQPTEDEVVIIDIEEAIRDEDASDRLEEELEEESEFGDFLSIVLGLMPGKARTKVGIAGDKPPDTEKRKRKPWTMERRIRRRLIGVLDKYIDSLGNSVYLPYLPSTAVARGLIVFLIFTRRLYLANVLDSHEYKTKLIELLSAFYGTPLLEPPIRSALHQRVLLSNGADIWHEKQAPYYVLASLFTLSESELSKPAPLHESVIRSLAGLAAMFGNLNAFTEDIAVLQSVAEHLELDATALVIGVEEMVAVARPRVIETLEAWLSRAGFDPTTDDDSFLPTDLLTVYQRDKRRCQANVDYRNALFHLYRNEKRSLHRRLDLCEELNYWCRRCGNTDTAAIWGERLVSLAESEGDLNQLADALYEQGKQLFFRHDYSQAVSRLRQAETLARRTGNLGLASRCTSYIKNAKFFLR